MQIPYPIHVANSLGGKIIPETVLKNWGYELIFHNDEKYCLKLLHIEEGQILKKHLHLLKEETFFVMSGSAWIIYFIDRKKYTQHLLEGEAFQIPPGLIHSIEPIDGPCDIIEASSQHFDNDTIRI